MKHLKPSHADVARATRILCQLPNDGHEYTKDHLYRILAEQGITLGEKSFGQVVKVAGLTLAGPKRRAKTKSDGRPSPRFDLLVKCLLAWYLSPSMANGRLLAAVCRMLIGHKSVNDIVESDEYKALQDSLAHFDEENGPLDD